MIRVVVGDVAAVKADAVVRAATTRLEPHDEIGRHLDLIGGPALANQRAVQSALAVGTAVVTAGGALAADLVIHAVLSREDESVTVPALLSALRSTLARAEQWEIDHLAVAPLGIDAGQLPFDDAASALLSAVRGHGGRFPSIVSVVVGSEQQRALIEALLARPA